MSAYVMSDIHGCYGEFLKMLEKINFSDNDVLYVLGDILDRGKNPVKLYLDIKNRTNTVCILGNHEAMALPCIELLRNPITEENIKKLTAEQIDMLSAWQLNGGIPTIDEFHKLSDLDKAFMTIYLYDSRHNAEITAGGKDYVLVHAGLENFSPDRPICSYSPEELIWHSPDYKRVYFKDRFLVTGHTPTAFIEGNPRPNRIYRKNNHIAIDCGAAMGGRLGCLRLDDGAEFYVECG